METNLPHSLVEGGVPGLIGSVGAVEALESSQVNDSTRAIPPVHRIASEILSEIFLSLTPPPLEMDNDGHSPSISRTEAPLLLCQICSYWREVAIGLPWLWTRIHVHANTEREMLDTWLARAKAVPLSLSLRGENESDPLTKFMDLLLPRVSQCQAIHYVSYPAQPLVSLFQAPPASMTYLESINIRVATDSPYPYYSSYNELDNTFEFCPRLRCARLRFDGRMFDLRTLRLPWSQLVVLSLAEIRCALDIASLFRQLTGLEELSMSIYEWEDGVAKVPSEPYPIFPKLFRLTLNWEIDNMTTPQLHNFITVPKLTEFTLRFGSTDANVFDHPGFDEMRTRSGFALEKLTLGNVFLGNNSEIANFFRLMPSIWSLSIESDATEIWPILSISDDKERLLPRLRRLRYLDIKLPTELVEMVESRWWPGGCDERVEEGMVLHRLKSVHLDILETRPRLRGVEASLVKRLSRCKDEGLDIKLTEFGLILL